MVTLKLRWTVFFSLLFPLILFIGFMASLVPISALVIGSLLSVLNTFLILRLSRISMLLNYVFLQAEREPDLRDLIGFLEKMIR